MGCCHSDDSADEKSALLTDEKETHDQTYQSLSRNGESQYIDKPNCTNIKCGQPMILTELQCCYLLDDMFCSLYNGSIDCENCMTELKGGTTLVWHCMAYKKHANEEKTDLCINCGEIIYQKQNKPNNMYNDENEEKKSKYKIFDEQYNIKNEINWNNLYELLHDDAKILQVIEPINKYIHLHPNYKEYLPQNILDFISTSFNEKEIAMNCHNTLHTHDDWTIQVNNVDNISIWYRQEPNSVIHSLKTKMLCKCTPLEFICVLNEFDLLTELISIIPIDTKLLKEKSITQKVIYIKAHLWFPLKNRDVIAETNAFDMMREHGEIIICGGSIDENNIDYDIDISDEEKENIWNPKDRTLRMDAKHSMGAIRPIKMGNNKDENLTEIISIINVDFKAPIPATILNWINRTMAFYQAKMIRQRCENLEGTKHAKRIATKPVYKKWKRGMKEYMAELRLKEKQKQQLQDITNECKQ